MSSTAIAPYAPAIIKLLKGVLYNDDLTAWNLLHLHETAVREFIARIGLDLFFDDKDGYAFLRQIEPENGGEDQTTLPRLTRRDRLSRPMSLLLVLLREQLDRFDASNPEADRLVIAESGLFEMMQSFLPERGDERGLRNKVRGYAQDMVDLGFLREVAGGDEQRYEVCRVIRAKLDGDKLSEIKQKLVGNENAGT
jgi:hypothetical protein